MDTYSLCNSNVYKSKYKINGKFHDDMLVELEKRKKANDAI